MSNWTDGLVLGTSAASAGDDELRSFMTQFASGISASYYWPGSGGGSAASAGESKLGNGRCARSGNISGGFPNGFLSLNTAHVSLHHIGTAPFMVGHSSMVEHVLPAFYPTFSTRWVSQVQIGNISTNTFGTFALSFTSSYDTTPSFVQIGCTSADILINLSTVTAGGILSSWSALKAGVATPQTIVVEADGEITI